MTARWPRALLLCLSSLLMAMARVAGAQELRGTITDSVSGSPIAGAVVTLLDASGAMLRRQLSDQRGEYRIGTDSNVRQMRVVRIGFRPRNLVVPRATAGVVQFNVVMVSIPTLLEPVQVLAAANCPRRSDRARASALMEQARAGLVTTVVARETKPAQMIRLRFVRHMDGNSDRVESQEVRIDASDQVATSFRAVRTATDFVGLGFRRDSAGTQEFFGPDADVLLDDGFTSGYCFQISDPQRERPNQIGLAFVPANHRNGRIDIEGALWIDTVARELRDLEFRYVGLDSRYDRIRAGGRISFRAMDNGVVMIDRWFFHLLGANTDTVYGRNAKTVRAVYYVRESGGEVARARWPDGTVWHSSLGTLRGLAMDHAGSPVAGAILRLADTDDEVTTDARGAFEISDLLPGPYTGTIIDAALAPLGIAVAVPVAFTAQRDSVHGVTFRVPTAIEYARQACETVLGAAGKPVDELSAWIIGRVVDDKGAPIKGARVMIDDGVKTGSNGLFYFCKDLTLGMTVRIVTSRGDEPEHGTLVEIKQPLTVLTIKIPPPL
jgi:hypothetical protein